MKLSLSDPGKLPYVILYHGTTPYRFIIDTGSTLSWITSEVAGKMLLEPESVPYSKGKNDQLESAIRVTLRLYPLRGDSSDYTAVKFSTILWCGEGSSRINDMNLHVKHKIDGILGADFLAHKKIDLDSLHLIL